MLNGLMTLFQMFTARLAREEDGQTLVEYALIIALVSVALVLTLGLLATAIGGVFTTIIGDL